MQEVSATVPILNFFHSCLTVCVDFLTKIPVGIWYISFSLNISPDLNPQIKADFAAELVKPEHKESFSQPQSV